MFAFIPRKSGRIVSKDQVGDKEDGLVTWFVFRVMDVATATLLLTCHASLYVIDSTTNY
jgi:hypothetical protein